MTTLNQIKNLFIDFFEKHGQITTVLYLDDYDFNADRNLSYPVVNIEYKDSNIRGKETSHSFAITLVDLVDQNIEGHEDEIYSDMLLIAEDFFSWAQESYDFNFQKSVNIQKIQDDMGDRTSGLFFRFQVTVIRSQNICSIPKKA